MKLNINTTIPIALAVILPILSFYSSTEPGFIAQFGFYEKWGSGAIIIYTLWHVVSLLSQKKYRVQIITFIILIVVILVIGFFRFNLSIEWAYVVRLAFGITLILIIQFAVKAQENISRLQLEKEQIQTENYKVQLQALRTTIDPHFLFNSLNTLRSMVRQQHINSEKFVMSLSDFYRQILKHNENTTLQLSEELKVLESYLFLMKNRNEGAMTISLAVDKSLYEFNLPTLALQIVVENCFKHNSMTSKMPLHIDIHNTADYYIVISNNIQPKIGDQESSGFGLDLLRKRYTLMNVKQGLIIQKTPDQFTVKLKLI